MGVIVTPLDLAGFDRLPLHVRRCVSWEVDPGTIPAADSGLTIDSEFDKEAWVSMVMLDWGTCAQIAIESSVNATVGSAFYAPPGRVPRAHLFPTSPVSPDAVLLMSVRVEPGHTGVAERLIDRVVADLIQRGVRAVEAFGFVRSAATSRSTDSRMSGDAANGLCAGCMIDAHLLAEAGFEVVAAHDVFPRYRLELDSGLSWKSAVENALEGLVLMASIDVLGRERAGASAASPGWVQRASCSDASRSANV
ncbi:hypothetical protein [Williamsia sp. CHRR-6]|uniref:hypothetical protein n=1 Tax=Williamsia sp. CHRR-6 TaxID=2835871 RepID=UPI0027DCD554|nr:hypothetical protein [Williamsia sp. CHRR-6]